MPELLSRGFPLFPLGIVALPTESVPLHVFEDRYRRMIEERLRAQPGSPEREFGIVWLSDQELKPVGCACDIEERIHLSQPTISHHMSILQKAGLVEAQKEGHWRWYRRNERTIKQFAKTLRQTL